MRSTIFFIIALLAVSQASTIDQTNFAQIEKSSFGEMMLDLIQINMQAHTQSGMKDSDLLDQIIELVQSLQSQMQADKKSADDLHSQKQSDFADKISTTNATLLSQRAQLALAQDDLARDRAKLAQTQSDLANDQQHLTEVTNAIQAADDANVLAVAAYEKKVNELNEAIDACNDAVTELAKLNAGSQFVQVNMEKVKGGMQQVQKVLQLHLPARLTIFKPIISALVDMGTNADPALVQKVSSLINQLLSSLESELSDSNTTEATRVSLYNQARANLVNDQSNTSQRISDAISLIHTLEANIAQNQNVVDQLNVLVPANQQLLDDTVAARDLEQSNYDDNDAERVNELATMDQLNKYLNGAEQQASAYLRNRIGFVQKRQI